MKCRRSGVAPEHCDVSLNASPGGFRLDAMAARATDTACERQQIIHFTLRDARCGTVISGMSTSTRASTSNSIIIINIGNMNLYGLETKANPTGVQIGNDGDTGLGYRNVACTQAELVGADISTTKKHEKK